MCARVRHLGVELEDPCHSARLDGTTYLACALTEMKARMVFGKRTRGLQRFHVPSGNHHKSRFGNAVAQFVGLGAQAQPVEMPRDDDRGRGDLAQMGPISIAAKADLKLVDFTSEPQAHPPKPFDKRVMLLKTRAERLADGDTASRLSLHCLAQIGIFRAHAAIPHALTVEDN